MLRIRLTKPILVNKKYHVFIDSDTKKSFNNKRQANDYVTKIENELNEALLFINESFCNLTTFYRTYFLADRDFKFKYEVENHFELINNRLTYISSRTQGENFNPIISQALNICFESLVEICKQIDLKSRTRYDMLTRRRIDLHMKIIVQYRDSFEHFKHESIYEDNLKSDRA